jgi:membrane protease YdiL (CAAX protease family)
MLSAKPWKPEAVLRLLLSVFICYCAGALVLTGLHYAGAGAKAGPRFYAVAAAALAALGAGLAALRQPWKLENFMRRVCLSLACFYAGLILGTWAQQLAGPMDPGVPSMRQMVVTSLSFHGAAIVLIGFFLREHQTGWPEAFGFSRNWPRAVPLGLLVACVFLPVGYELQRASATVMAHLPFWHFKPEEQLPVQTLRAATSWGQRLAGGGITIVLAPLAEEFLFRGVLYPWIRQAGFPRLALWGTALVFAAMHAHAASFVPLFLFGLVLTVLYLHTGNLLASIAAHSLFNALGFAGLYLSEKMFLIVILALALAIVSALLLLGSLRTAGENERI